MEEPPMSVDDLQPQDLSTSSLPSVMDLTRRGEECVLSPASLDALRRVTSSAWYQNSGTSTPGFSETQSSDITPQPGDQIQPDNAFSHTTVTLSYVSRSHVFSTQDSLSFSVPPLSRLSLHDSDKGLRETSFALNQHYEEQVEGPVDLAAQTLLQSLSQAQGGPGTDGGAYLTQEGHELNCGGVSPDRDSDAGDLQRGCWGLENGRGDTWSGSGVCAESSPETLAPAGGEAETSGDSEVIFLFSKEQAPVMAPGSAGVRDLCSLSREFVSPLEDPVSPSAASQDDVEDVFILPEASSSPSGAASYLETTEEAEWDSLRTEGGAQPGSDLNDGSGLDSSAENNHRPKAELEPLIDLTEDDSENQPQAVVPHVNGNTKTPRRTLKGKRLPARPGRGTRLETIVMSINSGRYKVSGCIRTKKKSSPSTGGDSKVSGPQRTDSRSAGQRARRASGPPTAKTKDKPVTPRRRGKTSTLNHVKDSTSDSKSIHNSKRSAGLKNSKQEAELLSHAKPSAENHVATCSPPKPSLPKPPPPPPSSTPSPKKQKGKAPGKKPSPTAKTTPPQRKRRRKKVTQSQASSMFAPKEPEIKLRYVNYKEEKRDLRADGFSPYVHVKHQQASPALCSVMNYPEEVRPQTRKQQAHKGAFISATIPSTSCLKLGRVSTHGQHRRSLVCCLCGHPANAMDLGDLHGPYYPEGYQLTTKTTARVSGLKEDEDDFSDSDSSCSVRGRGRKCPSTPRPLRPGANLKSPCWTGDSTGSPAAKRARSGAGSADVEDWYSPPVLPAEPCEYWLHEDCGIWSTGVYLVRGRVYGLEEVLRAAQETTCSACQDSGATLGCFFKGCPNKYHYRCALQSDCVLIEENFSMKCKKHKNKTFKASAGTRCDDR
ncbi:transcription factor 20 [Notolabrus celidotus]|uniref:transcription factor 20 n=1 Tax=Notolabrus celidotus TaxID=1203425 RepID=UPI00148FC43C|nr:transcription factor 20 [Notolabrus celidotus]XP_034563315.1 transcription factor 20 [Notolabrus celidotus]